MNSETRLIANAFPAPSPLIAAVLDELRLAAASPPDSENEMRRISVLPRPWDPASCPPELRQLIYVWLDEVVAWINEEHTWKVERVIPVCWMEHPHIVHGLAAVAHLRWEAGYAVSPVLLDEWHRYTLPTFMERIAQQIGTTGCPPGKHQPDPGAARKSLYRAAEEADLRRRRRNQECP